VVEDALYYVVHVYRAFLQYRVVEALEPLDDGLLVLMDYPLYVEEGIP
jgi:hypothetical protein